MDPDFLVLAALGALALAGRMSRGASAAGHTVRAGAGAVVTPVRSGLRRVPVVGAPAGTLLGAVAVVAAESVSEVLDGIAAAANWVSGSDGRQAEASVPSADASLQPVEVPLAPAATTRRPAATTRRPAATTRRPAATTRRPAAKPSRPAARSRKPRGATGRS